MTEQTTTQVPTPDDSDHPDVVVSLGTDHHSFDRLVRWIDDYAHRHRDLRVLVQHGHSAAPSRADGTPFLPGEELGELMRRARVVVTHGGPGTILQARGTGHLPIVVPRDPELDEHVDDHQLLFVQRLEDTERVRSCTTPQQLAGLIDRALASPDEFRVSEDREAAPERAALRAGALIDLLTAPAETPAHARPDAPGSAATATEDPPAAGTWPDVTVVVPTRDRPELLRRTLAAVHDQDYPGRITAIVVFDNDQPDPSLARSEDARPVRVVTNSMTPGLAGARNTGVLAADTDLVAFCDDDDTWLPGKLTAQVRIMLAEPGTEMVCCGIQVVYDRVQAERVLERTSITFADLLRSRLTELHPSTFLIRRRAMIDGCGTVSEEIPGSYAEDYELLLRLARRAPIRNIPEPGVRVLWHRRSYFSGRWQTIATALRWLLERYPEFGLVPRGYARVSGQIAFAEASAGHRGTALRWIWRTLRHRPLEGRAALALLVVCGVPPAWILRGLHLRGKGV
ncbi:UDP-N-acetylglucosamine transferase subunit ALG13 [Nocardiopsis sp. Huas11]|uniref:glycosyltransferase n=1 Tax=Nocardiopsis sp. Huas11 TaxID=2183912 RepID=UPI000EB0CC1F|nr:glycosyltransferase [Nocardiopsis sp. Huas11]RKS05602.1 UDP-N-acetylglucosamine transferase subunit ALG13 [Nocardiopsis sp. Huas11]